MKKQLFFGAALLAAMSVVSQNGKVSSRPTGFVDTKSMLQVKAEPAANKAAQPNNIFPAPLENTGKSAAFVPWKQLTGSMNIYGMLISYCKPLQYNDELNTVSFVHRKSNTYTPSPVPAANAMSGNIVGEISSNWGTSWDSTAIWNNDSYWGRYPSGGIINPQGNNTLSNAYIVGCGPTTWAPASPAWIGTFYASKKLDAFDNIASAAPNAQQWFSINAPYDPDLGRHDFAPYSFVSTDDAKVRVLAPISDGAADTAIMLVTGTLSAGTIKWAGTPFSIPSTQAGDGTRNWLQRPITAWSESGTIGYVMVMGQRDGATGPNSGLQPIVFKSTNSGNSWSLIPGINFNDPAFADVLRPINGLSVDTLKKVPYFNWIEGMDATVDATGKLHLFTSILGHPTIHPDSMDYWVGSYQPDDYLWPHLPGQQPYLYDFMTNGTGWSHITIDSMSTEGCSDQATGGGYADNPWDIDAGRKVRIDARLQMSRTPDGNKIIYTWAESDINFTNGGRNFNHLPNVKARMYDVLTAKVHTTEINITEPVGGGDPYVAKRAHYHYTSSRCAVTNSNNITGTYTISLPVTVSNNQNSPLTQLLPNNHWYQTASLVYTPIIDVGLTENAGSILGSVLFPNPATGTAQLQLELKDNSKVELSVFSAIGQLVRTYNVNALSGENNIQIDLSGLRSGVYLVNVKAGQSSTTKKLIVE